MSRFLHWLWGLVPYVILVVLMAAGAGFAWLTAHPETPWLEEAEDWAVVGGLAKRFRTAYLSPSENREEEAQEGAEGNREGENGAEAQIAETRAPQAKPRPRSAAGAPPAIGSPGAPRAPGLAPNQGSSSRLSTSESGPTAPRRLQPPRAAKRRSALPPSGLGAPSVPFIALEWRWFLPGHTLLASSSSGAKVLGSSEAMAYLPILDTEGPFVNVMFRGERVWIDSSWQPAFSRKKARRGIARARAEPVLASDSSRLSKARKILGVDKPTRKLGAYTLYTDVTDEDLLAFLDSAAIQAEDAYFARYGRLPSGNPKRSVVLFARRQGYRTFSEGSSLDTNRFVGHAGQGLTVFYVEGRSREELARTLVHEIAHLLNNRALANRLPPWLEEGLATDLGSVWVEASAAVSTGGGAFEGQGWVSQGPASRFIYLEGVLEQGQLPPLAILMGLDHEKFYSEALTQFGYSCSLATIRFFLDADGGRRAEIFREWLRRIAIGRGADPRQLAEDTDGGMEKLDANFRAWLTTEAAVHQERLQKQASAYYSKR